MKTLQNKAFTLVELIVVITILAVLATLGFISMTGYSRDSRDSVRLTDLRSITKAFEIQKTKDIKFQLPDKKVDISASGSVFQYQGLLSENILGNASVHGGGTDPQTGEYYGYAVNKEQNKFQLIAFLENGENIANNNFNISQSYADNSNKFLKIVGDNLGMFLDTQDYSMIIDTDTSGIDIETNTNEYIVVNKNDIHKSSNLKKALIHRFNPIASCNTILLNRLGTSDGIYTINPTGVDGEEFEVYCDMTTDGGGWTLLVHQKEPNYFSSSEYGEYTADGIGINAGKYSIFSKLSDFGNGSGYNFLYKDDTNNENRWQSFYKKGNNINIYPNLYTQNDNCEFKNNWGVSMNSDNNYCFYKMSNDDTLYHAGYALVNDISIGSWFMGVLSNRVYLTDGLVTSNWADGKYYTHGTTQYSFYVR